MVDDMNINEMTIADFENLKYIETKGEDIVFTSMVILPNEEMHESGYRCMAFVPVKDGEPLGKLGGGSDVLHIDGIGGYGKWNKSIPMSIAPKGWSIDCLPKSGLLHIFCNSQLTTNGMAFSSFEIYATDKRR